MGYFLTSQPENAVPGKTWVPPKTHTPGSRLEKRGYRFYNPEVGKWMSRDPVEEDGSLADIDKSDDVTYLNEDDQWLYTAFLNNPIGRFDVLGLLSPCEEWAKNNPDDVKGDVGGVVCKDGKKYACSWWPKGTYAGFVKCTTEHEKDHFDDVDCPACGLDRPGFKPGKDPDKEECHANTGALVCLQKNRKNCLKLKGAADRKKCLKAYDDRIDFIRCNVIPKRCKTPKPKGCK